LDEIPGFDPNPQLAFRMPYSASFAVFSERAASSVYSTGAVVVFSHDGRLWLLVLDESASHGFSGDLVINEIENRCPCARKVLVRMTFDDSKHDWKPLKKFELVVNVVLVRMRIRWHEEIFRRQQFRPRSQQRNE
jgi:hypothetical protein